MNRRRFLEVSAGAAALVAAMPMRGFAAAGVAAGAVMEPWRRGLLDIHHISTGRGNSVLAILPDGTSMMVDAGAKGPNAGEDTAAAKPDGSRRPGEWLGRYALHHLRMAPRQELDYFLATHLHDDHIGAFVADAPLSEDGSYRLTGVSDVAALVPVRRLLDRGYPDYSYPTPHTDATALNYIAFVRSAVRRGMRAERFEVGSRWQIVLQHEPGAFPKFMVRNLAANGRVWTGDGDATKALFPALSTLPKEKYPTENACSAALRLDYGKFRYYNGGDLTYYDNFGTTAWMDVESAVANAAGPVSVASLDHHGYYDADGPQFVLRMQARIWVVQSWHATHPALETLDRLYSPLLYQGPRDVLATSLVPAAELVDARLSDKMLSQQGHVVIRVAEGGASYEVIVLEDGVEQGKVKARFGPFAS